MTTGWVATLENIGVSFVVRVGRRCRFVSIFAYENVSVADFVYTADFDESKWDELLSGIGHDVDIFRRNLAQALRS